MGETKRTKYEELQLFRRYMQTAVNRRDLTNMIVSNVVNSHFSKSTMKYWYGTAIDFWTDWECTLLNVFDPNTKHDVVFVNRQRSRYCIPKLNKRKYKKRAKANLLRYINEFFFDVQTAMIVWSINNKDYLIANKDAIIGGTYDKENREYLSKWINDLELISKRAKENTNNTKGGQHV